MEFEVIPAQSNSVFNFLSIKDLQSDLLMSECIKVTLIVSIHLLSNLFICLRNTVKANFTKVALFFFLYMGIVD